MYTKIILNIFLILTLFITQYSLISGFPAGINSLNLILVILIFILVLSASNFNFVIFWTIGLGLLSDLFSFLPFGLHLASLALTVLVANLLLNHFFTNQSLYSYIALVGLATIVYELFLNGLNYSYNLFNSGQITGGYNGFLNEKLFGLLLNLLATLFIFYLLNFISNRLRPVFLMKRSK